MGRQQHIASRLLRWNKYGRFTCTIPCITYAEMQVLKGSFLSAAAKAGGKLQVWYSDLTLGNDSPSLFVKRSPVQVDTATGSFTLLVYVLFERCIGFPFALFSPVVDGTRYGVLHQHLPLPVLYTRLHQSVHIFLGVFAHHLALGMAQKSVQCASAAAPLTGALIYPVFCTRVVSHSQEAQ